MSKTQPATVGDRADTEAHEAGIAGTEFSYKLDGDVADRAADATIVDQAQVVELVEVTPHDAAIGDGTGEAAPPIEERPPVEGE